MKRGQGLSINMIILVVLGLIILVIAAVMVAKFSKRGNEGSQGTLDSACTDLQGTCEVNAQAGTGTQTGSGAAGPCGSDKRAVPGLCSKQGDQERICCVPN